MSATGGFKYLIQNFRFSIFHPLTFNSHCMSQSPFSLSGKVALVTGASRGLGQYFGRALARAGADLVITSRDAGTLGPFQTEIEGLGRRALPLSLDVRNYDSIQAMVQ